MSAASVSRLRMFAGPNGSGKSTIKSKVSEEIGEDLFGYYINPDEIEAEIKNPPFWISAVLTSQLRRAKHWISFNNPNG